MVVRASDPGAASARPARGWTLHTLPTDDLGPDIVPELAPSDNSGDLLGRLVGARFDVLELLSHGDLGSVYLARDRNYLRPVDLRVASSAGGPWALERARRRARKLLTVRHPNVAQVHGEGVTDGGLHYVASEHVEGRNLHHMHGDPRLVGAAVPVVALFVAEALAAIHAAGVVHGAVTPGNVVWLDDGERSPAIKLVDLEVRTAGDSNGLAEPGVHPYLPPGAQLDQLDERADLYSLAATLHELCTGRLPLGDPAPPAALAAAAGIPTWFADLLVATLAPGARPAAASARAFVDALRRGLGPDAPTIDAAAPPPPQTLSRTPSAPLPAAVPLTTEDGWLADLHAGVTGPAPAAAFPGPASPGPAPLAASTTAAPSPAVVIPPADAPRPAVEPPHAPELAASPSPTTSAAAPRPAPAAGTSDSWLLPTDDEDGETSGLRRPPPSDGRPKPAVIFYAGAPGPAPVPEPPPPARPVTLAPTPPAAPTVARPAVVMVPAAIVPPTQPPIAAPTSAVEPRPAPAPVAQESIIALPRDPGGLALRLVVAALVVVFLALAIWRLRSPAAPEAPTPPPAPVGAAAVVAAPVAAVPAPPETATLARTAEPPPQPADEPPSPAEPPSDLAADPTTGAPAELPDQLSAGVFRKIMLRANRNVAVDACYKQHAPGVDQTVEAVVIVAETGRVQKIRIQGDELGECLRRVITRLDFPAAARSAQHNFIFQNPLNL